MIKRGMAVALSVSLLAGAMSVSSSLPTAAASTKRVEVGTKGNVTINLDGREVWQAAADAMQKAQPVTGDIADRIMAQTGSNGNPVVLEDDIYKMELPAKALKGLPTGLGMEMYISAGAEDVAEDYTAAEEGEAAAVVAEVASASDLEATGVAEKPVRDFFASSMFSLIKENDEAAPAGGAAAAGGEGYELNGSEHIYFVLSNATDQDVNYTVKLGDLEILKTKVLKSHGDTTGVIGASVSDLIGVPASTSNMVRATESDMATASNLMEEAELTDDVVAKVVRTTLKNFFIIYRSEETALGTKAMVVTTADMKFKSKDGGVFTHRGDKMTLAVRDIDKNSEEYKQAAATLQNNNVDHADFAAVDISFRKGVADEDYEPCQGQIVNVRIETKAIENFDPESMSIQHHLDDGSLETVAGTTKKTVVEISDDAAEAVNNTVAVTEDQQTEITVEKKEDENVYTFDEEANKAAMEAQLSNAGKSEFKMEVGDGETPLENDNAPKGAPAKKAAAAPAEVKKNSVTKTISSAVDANGVKTETQEEKGNGDIKVEDGKVVADFVVDSFSIYTIIAQENNTIEYLSADGSTYEVTVDLRDVTNIPDGAVLEITELPENESKEYLKKALKALDKEPEDVLYSKALDISILYNGQKLQPDGSVKVEVNLLDKDKEILADVIHFGKETEVLNTETTEETVAFETDGFSVFAFVGTQTLATQYITASGETYEITVTYGPEAEIPQDAVLAVSETEEGSKKYENYIDQAAQVLGEEGSPAAVSNARFFDISILDRHGREVEPACPVEVHISYTAEQEMKKGNVVNAVHFAESSPEVVAVEEKLGEEGLAGVDFIAESFSVYGIVIVDTLPEGDYITKTFENEKWQITAAYTEEAKIPENAELRVSEITPESAPDAYSENAQLVYDFDDTSVIYAMLDIGFWTEEKEIEPEKTVYVTIKFKDEAQYTKGQPIGILHKENDQMTPLGYGELNEDLEASYATESFSLFVITDQGTIKWLQWTTDTNNYDPDWVSRGGTVNNFTNNLPLGTAAITGSMAVSSGIFETNNANTFKKEGGYVKCLLKKTANADTHYEGDYFTVTWPDAVTLQDGTTADLVVKGTNLKSRNAAGWMNLFYGTGVVIQKTDGGASIDLNYSVQRNGEVVPNYTLLFGVNDIDQPDRVSDYIYYKVQRATDGGGDFIAVQSKSIPSLVRFTEELTVQDVQGGKIQLANTKKERLYWTDANEMAMTTVVTDWPVYAKYKVMRGGGQALGKQAQTNTHTGSDNVESITNEAYVTLQPEGYSEAVSINGLKSKVYIPSYNFLHFEDRDGMHRMVSVKNDSSSGSGASGTAATGFFALLDSAGYTIRYTGSNGIGIGLTSGAAYSKIISTTGLGGNITTTDTDISGNEVTYGPGLLAVPKGKTVPYTMTPETFYHAKTVTIWDTTQVEANRSVIPIGDLLDEEGWVDGEGYSQKTVTVPYKDESDEYAKKGTESEITYILRKDASGTVIGYRAGTGTEPETQAFVYRDGKFTDSVRNVTYEITIDANKVLKYTFSNVKADHWIDVRWEKDPPQEAVIIRKEWNDNGNARQGRPENIVMHLVSTNGVKFRNEKTELVTGIDANINGNTDWVKDGNIWTYTYNNIPASAEFAVYEEPVSDYSSENIGEANKKQVTEYKEETDEETGITTRTYTVTVTNNLKPGVLEFTKQGETPGVEPAAFAPLAGATFTLYTDKECLYPAEKTETSVDDQGNTTSLTVPAAATSGADGKVSLTGVACGMYYMKETVVPGDYDANSTLYQVWIKEDSKQSTITVVTADPDGSGELSGNAEEGYVIKNILAKFDVIIRKVSANNTQLRLPSAEFVLYGADYIDNNGNINPDAKPLSSPVEASKRNDAQATSNNNKYANYTNTSMEGSFYSSRNGNKNTLLSVYGHAPLGVLKTGTYYLVEIGSPAGYVMPTNPVTKIVVSQTGVTAGKNGEESSYTVIRETQSGVYTYRVLVPNDEGVELPLTGGSGTWPLRLTGMALLLICAMMYSLRRKAVKRSIS